MRKKYIVTLTDEEQAADQALTHRGRVAARRLTRAHLLRMAHENSSDEEIAEALTTSVATVERVREKFVLGGLEYALSEDSRPGAPHKLDGKQEAFLVALACTEPPIGHVCWTMQLLDDRLVEFQIAPPPLSDETVRRTPKNELKPWLRQEWCMTTVTGEFVCHMEDVLDLYAEPYNPAFPVIGFDERPCHLVVETRAPWPPGSATDSEMRRMRCRDR